MNFKKTFITVLAGLSLWSSSVQASTMTTQPVTHVQSVSLYSRYVDSLMKNSHLDVIQTASYELFAKIFEGKRPDLQKSFDKLSKLKDQELALLQSNSPEQLVQAVDIHKQRAVILMGLIEKIHEQINWEGSSKVFDFIGGISAGSLAGLSITENIAFAGSITYLNASGGISGERILAGLKTSYTHLEHDEPLLCEIFSKQIQYITANPVDREWQSAHLRIKQFHTLANTSKCLALLREAERTNGPSRLERKRALNYEQIERMTQAQEQIQNKSTFGREDANSYVELQKKKVDLYKEIAADLQPLDNIPMTHLIAIRSEMIPNQIRLLDILLSVIQKLP